MKSVYQKHLTVSWAWAFCKPKNLSGLLGPRGLRYRSNLCLEILKLTLKENFIYFKTLKKKRE